MYSYRLEVESGKHLKTPLCRTKVLSFYRGTATFRHKWAGSIGVIPASQILHKILVPPLVLRVPIGGVNRSPSGDPSTRLPPIKSKVFLESRLMSFFS